MKGSAMPGWVVPPPKEPAKSNDDFRRERERKVQELHARGLLRTERIREALLKVRREQFVPRRYRDYAYEEVPIPLPGVQSSISAGGARVPGTHPRARARGRQRHLDNARTEARRHPKSGAGHPRRHGRRRSLRSGVPRRRPSEGLAFSPSGELSALADFARPPDSLSLHLPGEGLRRAACAVSCSPGAHP